MVTVSTERHFVSAGGSLATLAEISPRTSYQRSRAYLPGRLTPSPGQRLRLGWQRLSHIARRAEGSHHSRESLLRFALRARRYAVAVPPLPAPVRQPAVGPRPRVASPPPCRAAPRRLRAAPQRLRAAPQRLRAAPQPPRAASRPRRSAVRP